MTSISMRQDPLFMRNTFPSSGRLGFPCIKKQDIDLFHVELIACSDTCSHDFAENRAKGVHHFVDDYRFDGVYNHPEKSLEKYKQYRFVLSPDFSMYADMSPWRQIESVAKNRWVGAYWQSKGLLVIPTISWSTPSSFAYCFDGVERGSVVAVGMIGCRKNRLGFLRGYHAMMEHISPKAVICFGNPFSEMEGNIIPVDYRASRKVVR